MKCWRAILATGHPFGKFSTVFGCLFNALYSVLYLCTCLHLFGCSSGGSERLLRELRGEVLRLSERNLGRDDRVLSDSGREARAPFLDENVLRLLVPLCFDECTDQSLGYCIIQYCKYEFYFLRNYVQIRIHESLLLHLRLRQQYTIKYIVYCNVLWLLSILSCRWDLSQPRGVGEKLLLRLVARRLGLRSTAVRPKRAMQFGSRIARRDRAQEEWPLKLILKLMDSVWGLLYAIFIIKVKLSFAIDDDLLIGRNSVHSCTSKA